MVMAWIRRLESYQTLSDQDKAVLSALVTSRQRVEARKDLILEGEPAKDAHAIIEGFACRSKVLRDGRRQILHLLLPGDVFHSREIVKEMDHTVSTLSPVVVAAISRSQLTAVASASVQISRALKWTEMVEEAISREWIVNVGQRTAIERVAHLFCETFFRLKAIGQVEGDECEFPLTQTELAEAVALSPVHVNRTLQELRRTGLLVLRNGKLTICSPAALCEVACFNLNYLHLGRHVLGAGGRYVSDRPPVAGPPVKKRPL
jgi:CRP-like cAMP-binding protein